MAQLLVGGDDDILQLEVCVVVLFAVNNYLYNVSALFLFDEGDEL